MGLHAGGAGGREGYLLDVQRARLLNAAVDVLAGEGVRRLGATRVCARAGMSTKTFYDLFASSEDCFLGVFDRAVDELSAAASPAWAGEDEWVERVRSGLVVLLGCLERDPALARVVFVEALGAGPRVLERRAEVLDRVAELIDEGREASQLAGVLPSLTAAGVVGAAFSLIHARLVGQGSGSLMELVGPVMATVVLPYLGREASARELARPVPELPVLAGDGLLGSREGGASGPSLNELAHPLVLQHVNNRGRRRIVRDRPAIASVKLTERTCSVLASVGERPGANNRQIAAGAGVDDEPQISRLLARLQEHGLVENRGSQTVGLPKAWWLTASGEEFLGRGRTFTGTGPATGRTPREPMKPAQAGRRGASGRRGVKRAANKQGGRYLGTDSLSDCQPRLTYRTALVLEAIAKAPGISNLGVARHAQINDQGQVSKLLARLQRNGLVQNAGRGQNKGTQNEWHLTPAGEEVERGIHEHQRQVA
jgi:AcrR family transcriptional regulator/DNA-binding MarR family transcriptional regulator